MSSFVEEQFSLKGEVAIVTGGTGELCSAMAQGFAQPGAKVAIVGRDAAKAQKRLHANRNAGGDAGFMPAAVPKRRMNRAGKWGPQGVRVNALSPGFFPAEQSREILQPGRVAKILAPTPMNRFGEAGELMGPAVFLCARKAGSFVTGCHLTV